MNYKEIMETIQLKKKDKKTGIVLIFIASLFAIVTAIYGAFRFGKKKGTAQAFDAKSDEAKHVPKSDVKGSVKARKQHRKASAAEDASVSVVYRPAAPKPVYVVRPLEEKKRESRGKRFRRHLCAAASAILVISMVGSATMQYAEQTTALAKESFAGIGKIVDEHDDEPYRILDIVPADAKYYATTTGSNGDTYAGEYDFTIGTMGYLVNGQASIIGDLEKNFKDNPKVYSYEARKNLIDTLITSNSTPSLTYREAYPGVDTISESAGWIQIFGQTDVPKSDNGATGDSGDTDSDTDNSNSTDSANFATGQFRGTWEPSTNGDFRPIKIDGSRLNNRSNLSPDTIYEYKGQDGYFRLRFELMDGSEEMAGGYIAHVLGDMSSGDYPYTTCVYEEISPGVYRYVATIGQLVDEDYNFGSASSSNSSSASSSTTPSGDTTVGGETPGIESGSTTPGGEDTDNGNQDGNNTGNGNQDGDNTGNGNQDGDNTGNGNQDGDNTGNGNQDGNNTGNGNQDGDNTGNGNQDGDSTDNGGDAVNTENSPASEFSEPTARAIVLPDGWRLLVEGDGLGTGADFVGVEVIDNGNPADGNGDGANPGADDNGGGIAGDGATGADVPSGDDPVSDVPNEDGGSFTGGGTNKVINWENYAGYKIVYFEYIEEPWEGAILYKVVENQVEEIPDGVPRPFDSYSADRSYVTDYSISTLSAEIDLLDASPNSTGADTVFVYTPGQGTYKLTRTDVSTDKLIEIQGAPVYFRCTTNNDWLKQYVFSTLSGGDNESDDFEIEVDTVRADEVTAAMIVSYDLLYLESGQGNVVLNTGAMALSYIGDAYPDMSESAVKQILESAAEDLKPVIVDHDIVTSEDHYKESNYQYLAMALMKEDLAEFYAKMNEKGDLMANIIMNVADSKDFPVKDDNNSNYVNQNVYMVNDSAPLVSSDFHESFSSSAARAGFSDVLTAIRAENTMVSEDDRISEYVSKARAVQYIINFSVGVIGDFSNLRILEIQPSANPKSDFSLADDGTKLVWKKEPMTSAKQILFSKEAFNIETDIKSVVEFNGEWEDLNGTYDFIFIGLDGQRLNLDDEGETVYNNSDLDGKVYHRGDESGAGVYDGNDLTAQKMDDLLDYMKAGYPVLVENDCFEEGSAQKANADDINTDYIQEGSTMYYFLRNAVSDDQYEDCIFTVSDVMSNSMFMTKVRISKPRISLVDENEEEASRVLWLERDENDEYHGQLRYQIKDNRDDDYLGNAVVKVYADYNYDGYFSPAEELTEFLNEDNVLDIKIDGMGPGILPWKLEVSDVGNRYRRDSVQGYFEMGSTAKDELKVLQITENKGSDAVNLQFMFDKKEDSMLAYYLRGAETILNTEMQFETVTASQLETRLSENGKYLEQWDVVVLTLDNAAESSAVADALNRHVADGRSLLVCGQDPGYGRAGLSGGLLGQTDDRTFVDLGGNGASGRLRYADLDYDMFGGKTGLKAEAVNDGSISIYPYVIDDGFRFGDAGQLKAAPYLLNFEDNLKTEEIISYVTAWYTFGSDSRNGSAYGISPKDSRNNYYCYSKGNVFYLAQSEYAYTCNPQSVPAADEPGVDECRFFVNALIATYNAGLHNAHINIVSGFSPDAADIQSISVPFDEKWLEAGDSTQGILDTEVDVFFKFRDNNFAAEKTTLVGFCYEDPNGSEELIVDGKTVRATPFGSEVWTVTDNRLVQMTADDSLQPGKVYRIKAPVVSLQNLGTNEAENKADIYIVLQTTFARGGRYYDIISTDAVSLNRARLFLLE